MAAPLEDSKWVQSSFMIPSHAADLVAAQRARLSSAYSKFTDTTLGGNFAINPPPQFTRSADLKVRNPNARSRGMGRKYSEMIDDNSQVVHMRFGIPQFNSLMTFFTGFYDTSASLLSRTGRSPGFFYSLGRVSGFVVTLPLLPLIMAGRIYRYLARKPSSKFYYLKPAMPLYWNAVNSISNGIAVNMGIIPGCLPPRPTRRRRVALRTPKTATSTTTARSWNRPPTPSTARTTSRPTTTCCRTSTTKAAASTSTPWPVAPSAWPIRRGRKPARPSWPPAAPMSCARTWSTTSKTCAP